MSRDALIVLQARRIEPAIASLSALPIDKAWFSGFDEPALVGPLNAFIKKTNYRRYILAADDIVVDGAALDRLSALSEATESCFTGWCRLCAGDERVNLSHSPLTRANGKHAQWSDYSFVQRGDILSGASVNRSYLAGWALTSATRETWIKHPFRVNAFTGRQSDYEWSMAMQEDGEPIFGVRECEVIHLKQHPDHPLTDGWIVGREPSRITLAFC